MDAENKEIQSESKNEDSGLAPEVKDAIDATLSKLRMQSMLLGAQAICKTIQDKIYTFESSNGKKSANDYKRCLKDIKSFCAVGLSRKIDANGEVESVEETVQN